MKKLTYITLTLLTSAAYGADQSKQPSPNIITTASGAHVIKSGCPYIEDATYVWGTTVQSQIAAGKVTWGITRRSGCYPAVDNEWGWIPVEEKPTADI